MQTGELIRSIQDRLDAAGIADPGSETRIILREILNTDTAMLLGHPEKEVPAADCAHIDDIVNRRLMREPLQYILGKWNFMGLDFCVRPGVLIPRPDTEILVECALKNLHDGMRILDLCTGTGCILISLLHYSNGCTGTGVDISETALEVARINAGLLTDRSFGPEDDPAFPQSDAENTGEGCGRAKFVYGDLYDGADGMYDMIVSNPPYINTEVIDTLEPEVKDHEPHLALDGGQDGLDLIKRIISGADGHLLPGGELFMEIGYDQGERVCSLMKASGFTGVECIKDYCGLDRVVHGIRRIL